jgi:uncharacterized membrane protein YhhN
MPTSAFSILTAITAVAVLALLAAEALGRRVMVWIAKPTASTAFVAAAFVHGMPTDAYGIWVVVALVLSWWGDVLLIPRSQKVFLAGILAFLSAHVAYAIAFVARGIALGWLVASGLPLALLGALVGRYFVRHAPAGLKRAVVAYIGVLSTMVALALAAWGRGGGTLLPIAAIAFYLSDISVALNRFVRPSLAYRAWGAPLYFGAQLLFAATVVWR